MVLPDADGRAWPLSHKKGATPRRKVPASMKSLGVSFGGDVEIRERVSERGAEIGQVDKMSLTKMELI